MTVAFRKIPVSSKIIKSLRSRIITGQWKSGEQLPTEKELAKKFNVCSSTVKKSLKEIEREGLIFARRGKGRFVRDKNERIKTSAIEIILFDMNHLTHPVMSQVLSGIKDKISETDYHLRICALNSSRAGLGPDNPLVQIPRLELSSAADGVIIVTWQVQSKAVFELANSLPVVWINHPTVQLGLAGVMLDYTSGAFQATRHLLELGHRRIALVTTRENCNIGRAQQDGFRLACSEISPPDDKSKYTISQATDFFVDEGRRLGQLLVDTDNMPSAIICGSGDLTCGVYEALSNTGLKVPDDISIVSWNDSSITADIPVKLTTVIMDHYRAGLVGANSLLRQMEHPGKLIETERIPAKLVIRESTREVKSTR